MRLSVRVIPIHSVLAIAALAVACAAPTPPIDATATPPRSDAAVDSGAPIDDGTPDAADDDASGADDADAGAEAASPAATISFGPVTPYACGKGAARVATGDFNGDHHADVAAAFDRGVCVFFGRADGSLEPARVVQFDGAGALAARDVNGDGLDDLAIGAAGGIALMLALPGGGFATPTAFEGGEPYGFVALADLDGDGVRDLVGAKAGKLEAELLSKKGEYRKFVSYAGALLGPFAAADLDGDGREDVVAATSGPSFSVLAPAADGTIASARAFPAIGASALTLGDFDRDDRVDVVVQGVTNGLRRAAVYFGNGDGTFAASTSSVVPVVAQDAAAADFNRDRALDLAMIGGGSVYVLRGRGDGAFDATGPFATGLGAGSVAAADLDGDGYPDLVAGAPDAQGIVIMLNRSRL